MAGADRSVVVANQAADELVGPGDVATGIGVGDGAGLRSHQTADGVAAPADAARRVAVTDRSGLKIAHEAADEVAAARHIAAGVAGADRPAAEAHKPTHVAASRH